MWTHAVFKFCSENACKEDEITIDWEQTCANPRVHTYSTKIVIQKFKLKMGKRHE